LYHVFQDDCNNGDKVDDTPPATGPFTNANCPAAGNSCSTDSPDKLDLWEDYMDYSNGSCQCLFTKLQKTRMHSYLTSGTSPRTTNVSTSNLIATGITPSSVAPVATFTSSAQVICAGQSVKFYDLSCKSLPTAWSWTFTGSSQPSASTQNPTVTYQTPGVYPVSLTVQNTKGSNSVTKSSYITVLKAAGANKPNFEQGFENGDPTAFTTSDKFVHSSPTTSRFALETTVGYTGSNCYKAPIATGSAAGSTYSITLPSFDISGMGASTPRFTFYSSYAQPDATVTEVMRVYVSTDCGASFKQILERSGAALAYSGQVYTNNFKPTKSTNWRLSGVTSLSSIGYGLNQNLTFRIDVISGGGNPVYIDNINIGAFYAGINTIGKDLMGFEVSPNPVEANSKIVIHSAITDEEVTVVLLDLQGRKVANIFSGKILESNTTLYMSDLLLPSSGLYVISMESSKGSIQKPVIFGK
jgi:PKD repeat protein